MTFFVHEMTFRLGRTLKIGTGKASCTRNPKITFKTSKNQPFLSYCTYLPKFECGMTKLWKSMSHYWKIKIFFFCCSTQFELSVLQKWSLIHFPLAHNLTSKTGIFFASRCVTTIWSCCFHWRISKPKPIFLLNQKHQLLQFITIFHVAIVDLIHQQKIRSYL